MCKIQRIQNTKSVDGAGLNVGNALLFAAPRLTSRACETGLCSVVTTVGVLEGCCEGLLSAKRSGVSKSNKALAIACRICSGSGCGTIGRPDGYSRCTAGRPCIAIVSL